MTNPTSDEGVSTLLLTNTFQASLLGGAKGPFEFKMNKDGIELSGVIEISTKR